VFWGGLLVSSAMHDMVGGRTERKQLLQRHTYTERSLQREIKDDEKGREESSKHDITLN
jgi:hypothetical protein